MWRACISGAVTTQFFVGLFGRPFVQAPPLPSPRGGAIYFGAEAHESAIRTDALLGRMHNLGVLGFSCAKWRLLRELRLRAIFHLGRVVSARGGRLSDCPCCPTCPNLEHAHAKLALVTEGHRLAGQPFSNYGAAPVNYVLRAACVIVLKGSPRGLGDGVLFTLAT